MPFGKISPMYPPDYRMQTRIVCIGNRFFAPDSAGPQVYMLLSDQILPAGVELVDGGLGGLHLLPCLENTDLVIFVDAVSGFRQSAGIALVDPLATDTPVCRYDHDAGLAYLLGAAPYALEDELPNILLVGIEGSPTPELCRQAADACLALTISRQKDKDHSPPAILSSVCHG